MSLQRTIEPWSALLDEAREDGRLVREAREGPGKAQLVEPPEELHPEVLAALSRLEIERLYSHQAEAVYASWEGPTIVTTGTASGKSMCFNLPTLDVLCRDTRARALYLYPTKALAQDQARALAAFGLTKHVRPAIYDGDTPREARADIRRRANVVLTNPDMLHVGILPNHPAWAELFANLAVVVVDEAHVYRGVFGSHVANVLRRLRRIAAAYGTTPRFLLTSATIANPVELAERLTGLEDFSLIDVDGSPAPGRQIAVWNPPLTDEDLGQRRSALAEAAELLARLVRDGARLICFMKSRKGVEVLHKLLVADLEEDGDPELARLVAPYRAGYTSQQRRELEGRLVRGELRAVITTDALELGIDIGELDAAVVVTFPGTVASLRQMWGRAGRRGRGLAVYVAGEDALDQFFCRHPDDFLERPVEAAILDHENAQIFRRHLLCAAHEGPLSGEDAEFLGPRWEAHAEVLQSAGELRRRSGRGPVDAVPGRSDRGGAGRRAQYLRPPRIRRLPGRGGLAALGLSRQLRDRRRRLRRAARLDRGRPRPLDRARGRDLPAPRALLRGARTRPAAPPRARRAVRRRLVHAAQARDRHDDRAPARPPLDARGDAQLRRGLRHRHGARLPAPAPGRPRSRRARRARPAPHELLHAGALVRARRRGPGVGRLTIGGSPEGNASEIAIPLESLLGALHATEHAQIAVLPLIAMCDRWDIGGLSTNLHPQTGGATIFIYDGHPGGIGITRTAFHRFEELCRDAHRLIAECPCASGCPSCVQSPKCGNLNEPLSKAGARLLLERMLGTGEEAAAGESTEGRRSERDSPLLKA